MYERKYLKCRFKAEQVEYNLLEIINLHTVAKILR